MRVVLYARVSTDLQEAENQLVQLRDYCNSKDWPIVKEYVDVVSGGKDSRPAFDMLFEDAREAKFDMLIFWALDRFSRSGTLYTLQRLKELELLGVDWHSFKEPYFSTVGQFKEVVISIMATLAKIERERISERTKAAYKANVKLWGKRGKDKGMRKRLGYYQRWRKSSN